MELAAGSLLELATDGKTPILLGRILSSRKRESVPSIEAGLIVFRIEREITTNRWHGPPALNVFYERFANPLQRAMQAEGWNRIDIAPNTNLLLGVDDLGTTAQAIPPPAVPARTVAVVQDGNDPLVLGLGKALQIEKAPGPVQQKAMIAEGFASQFPILNDYCHNACGRLHRVPRADAVDLELALLENENAQIDNRRAAVINLELELWQSGTAQDTLNRRIVNGLFRTLPVNDRELRRMLLEALDRILFANAPAEVKNYRQQLLKDVVPLPSWTASLQESASQGPAAEEAKRVLVLFRGGTR